VKTPARAEAAPRPAPEPATAADVPREEMPAGGEPPVGARVARAAAPGLGEIRYVPVSDPADAGGGGGPPALSLRYPRSHWNPIAFVQPLRRRFTTCRIAAGPRGDPRFCGLADELLSRTVRRGRSVDAALAARSIGWHRTTGRSDARPSSAGHPRSRPGRESRRLQRSLSGIDSIWRPRRRSSQIARVPQPAPSPTPAPSRRFRNWRPPRRLLNPGGRRASAAAGEPADRQASAVEFSLAFDGPAGAASVSSVRDREPDRAAGAPRCRRSLGARDAVRG